MKSLMVCTSSIFESRGRCGKKFIDEKQQHKTKLISIPGVPFKWQLGIEMTESAAATRDVYNFKQQPEVLFKMIFSEDDTIHPTKFKEIGCDFKVGAYWKGSAAVFPKKTEPTRNIRPGELILSQDGSLALRCHLKVVCHFFVNERGICGIEDSQHGAIKTRRYIGDNILQEPRIDNDDSRSCTKKLMKDIGAMLLNEDLSDFTLGIKNHELKVHKWILAARSPVFKHMFATNKDSIRVMLLDVSFEAAKLFVKFLYTAEVTTTEHGHSKDLLTLATMYQIEDLKEAYERMIITQLNGDNALGNLYIANQHKLPELKTKSFQMIAHGPLSMLRTFPDGLMNKPEEVEEMMTAMKKWYDPPQNGNGGLKRAHSPI